MNGGRREGGGGGRIFPHVLFGVCMSVVSDHCTDRLSHCSIVVSLHIYLCLPKSETSAKPLRLQPFTCTVYANICFMYSVY